MKYASESVWESKSGHLVPAGDEQAAFLFAPKGHPVDDKRLSKFDPAEIKKFFRNPETENPAASKLTNDAPKPINREDDQAKRISKRGSGKKFDFRKSKKK